MYRDVKVYDIFVDSAKEGITTVVKIIPPLVGLIVATGVFRASGALELLIYAAKPIAGLFNIPSETLPLVFIRPISGSASLALLSDILKEYGADSFIGRVASTMMGSTETIFYTLTVYFGAVGVKSKIYPFSSPYGRFCKCHCVSVDMHSGILIEEISLKKLLKYVY